MQPPRAALRHHDDNQGLQPSPRWGPPTMSDPKVGKQNPSCWTTVQLGMR